MPNQEDDIPVYAHCESICDKCCNLSPSHTTPPRVWPILCSGSMKNHLPLLKETLQFMVQQLRSDDKLCIITFDHEV